MQWHVIAYIDIAQIQYLLLAFSSFFPVNLLIIDEFPPYSVVDISRRQLLGTHTAVTGVPRPRPGRLVRRSS